MTWSREELAARLRRVGSERYHDKHPFNLRMHEGTLAPAEIRCWVRNRYYYQTRIPVKDAAILAKSPEADFRRQWISRIHDHDGRAPGEGGLELWLRLAEAVGLERAEVEGLALLLPGVRFAVDAYVNFARRAPWLEGVCASLSELFAPEIHRQRLVTWPEHYPWIERAGLTYFQRRVSGARRDVEYGLALTLERCRTAAAQERALEVLEFKLDVLWQMNDAMALAYGVAQ